MSKKDEQKPGDQPAQQIRPTDLGSRARAHLGGTSPRTGKDEDDAITREARKRHRAEPVERITGKHTTRQLVDTTREGGVGGTLEGLYITKPGAEDPPAEDDSPNLSPQQVADKQHDDAHGPQGDASEDFTGERAADDR